MTKLVMSEKCPFHFSSEGVEHGMEVYHGARRRSQKTLSLQTDDSDPYVYTHTANIITLSWEIARILTLWSPACLLDLHYAAPRLHYGTVCIFIYLPHVGPRAVSKWVTV